MQFVQVCINTNVKSLDKLFTYKLPAALEHIEVGHRVIVPFGNMLKEGVVLEKVLQLDGAIELEKLKEVLDIVDEQPWFSREMLNTARNIADYYLCSYPEALKLFLVGNTGIKAEKLYVLAQGEKISALTGIQQTICQCLQGKVKNWKITFDWFVLPNNFTKVFEGQYEDSGQEKKGFNNFDGRNYDMNDLERKLIT